MRCSVGFIFRKVDKNSDEFYFPGFGSNLASLNGRWLCRGATFDSILAIGRVQTIAISAARQSSEYSIEHRLLTHFKAGQFMDGCR